MEKTEPHSGLPRLAFKIGAGGFAWIKARLAAEVTNPTTRMGRTIHALTRRGVGAVSALPRSVRRSLASGKDQQAHEILFAFYDLKVAPVRAETVAIDAAPSDAGGISTAPLPILVPKPVVGRDKRAEMD